MKKKSYTDELDLYDIFIILLENRKKIISITVIFIFLGLLYFFFTNKNFLAETNIKPISTFDSQKYKIYNSLAEGNEEKKRKDIIQINQKILLNLFINKIQTGDIVEEGIIKFNLINKDKFNNEEKYINAIKKNSILLIDQMIPPVEDKKKNTKSFWKFNFNVDNKETWNNFLQFVEKEANEQIRLSVIEQFYTEIEILKTIAKFELEDIEQKITNALNDYKVSVSRRLAFLEEQAQIARTLDIAKSTLQADKFLSDNTIVTNIKSEDSYYLKGYEMIEKEISLINSRKNDELFTENLQNLNKIKRNILQNQRAARLEYLFLNTPISDEKKFMAAKVDFLATNYEPSKKLSIIVGFSVIIGLLISYLYLFINYIRSIQK